MNLQERRQKLAADLSLVEQQQTRLLAAAQDASRQAEQFRGAIALIDEMLQTEPSKVAGEASKVAGEADG
jgi:hypothetical protein